MDTTTATLKTKVDANGAQSETVLTMVWDDAKAEREFATRGVKIAAQSIMRATGEIPAEFTVTISELAKRERGGFAMKPTPQNAARMLGKLDDAQYAAALATIGIAPREVERLVKSRANAIVIPASATKVPAKK